MPYIDPQVLPVIENMKNFRQQRGNLSDISPEMMRLNFNKDTKKWNEILPEIDKVTDFSLSLNDQKVPVRLYDPDSRQKLLPTMIFIHGGGWIVGNLDTNERCLRLLSIRSGMRILSIDYPLAPENPFPAGLNCIVEICKLINKSGKKWGLDTNKLTIAGDSAGGNLALSAAVDLRNSDNNFLRNITLIYPALSPDSSRSSYQQFGQGDYGMGIEAMEFFWEQYLQDENLKNDPRAVPLLADIKELPAMTLITPGLDPLQDDSFDLIKKLNYGSIKYQHFHYPGVVHGFVSMCHTIDEGDKAISDLAANLRNLFNADME